MSNDPKPSKLKTLDDGFNSSHPGVYEVCVRDGSCLFPVAKKSKQVIYIGMARKLRDRGKQHLATNKPGWSTLRLSLGAILRQRGKLKFRAKQRNENEKQFHVRFDDKGEEDLTKWMRNNLLVRIREFHGMSRKDPDVIKRVKELEKKLIMNLMPPLTLRLPDGVGKPLKIMELNKQAKYIRGERKNCREEAKIDAGIL